jgi:hypothetical protein
MDFFEPPAPPEPPEPPEFETRPWWHAPRNELGAATGMRLVLARTGDVVVALLDVVAYTTGVDLKLVVAHRVPRGESDPLEPPFGHFMRRTRAGGELPPELLRFGVQFADGRKATSRGSTPFGLGGEGEPEGPLLSPGGGGGGDDRWESDFWLWPLPPPGPLAFVAEWPAEGIELTRHEVDAAPILEASRRSEVLWPEQPPGGGAWTSFTS